MGFHVKDWRNLKKYTFKIVSSSFLLPSAFSVGFSPMLLNQNTQFLAPPAEVQQSEITSASRAAPRNVFRTKAPICTNCAPYSASAIQHLPPPCSLLLLPPPAVPSFGPSWIPKNTSPCCIPPAHHYPLSSTSCPVISLLGRHMAVFELRMKYRTIKK